MTTKTLSLSELNEAVTETQEARPTRNPNVIMQPSPGGYWKSWRDLTGDLKWRTLYQFTADVGAIKNLIFDSGAYIEDCSKHGGFTVDAWHNRENFSERWEGECFTELAPALCCAYLFALDGIRRDVEDIRRDGGEGGAND